jgi:hypothetical protein
MKKRQLKKLDLHRETLLDLEPKTPRCVDNRMNPSMTAQQSATGRGLLSVVSHQSFAARWDTELRL